MADETSSGEAPSDTEPPPPEQPLPPDRPTPDRARALRVRCSRVWRALNHQVAGSLVVSAVLALTAFIGGLAVHRSRTATVAPAASTGQPAGATTLTATPNTSATTSSTAPTAPAGTTGSSPPPCPTPDSSWTAVTLSDNPTAQRDTHTGWIFDFQAIRLSASPLPGGEWQLVMDITIQFTDLTGRSMERGIFATTFQDLWVGRTGGHPASCFNPISGRALLQPGERAPFRFGYELADDPRDVDLVLQTYGEPLYLTRRPG